MSNKKFSPSLLGIPEEDSSLISESNNLQYEFSEKKSVNRDQRNISSTLENEDFKSMNSHFNPKDFCCSSDAKQRIIQKWLEDVPIMMHEDDQKAKVKDSSRIKASAEDKILSNPNFWETNELDGNKTNKIKENSNEFANSAKIDRKRPSTKARPPPLPPLKPLKSLNENSPSFLPLNVQEKDDSKITRQKESVIEVKIPEKMNRTLQYETECCLTQSSAAFSTHPPHPPPLPPSNLDQKVDNFRLNEKDNIQPIFAKNLMDAVIQELTDYRKNEKLFKSKNSLLQNQGDKNLIKKDENQNVFNINERNNQTLNLEINETLCLKSECLNAKPTQTNDMCVISTNNKPREEESTKKSENKVQDEHEYEIIILNPEEGKTKNSKRLNLPEMFSVNERHEGYSLVSEVYVNDNYSCSSGRSSSSVSTSSVENEKINYKVMNEKNGRLTIHVKDSPNQHNELVCESDHFEPDTLERKQQKSKLVQRFGSKNGSDKCDKYSNQKFHDMDCTKETDNSDNNETFVDSLERPSIMLKTNGSFKRNSLENDVNELFKNLNWTKMANFGSLREIYEAKSKNHKKRSETTSLVDLVNCEADCMSTLSWNEERRNKLLHRGIVLHIDEDEGAGAKRTFPKNKSYVTKYACPEKVPSALPPKPSVVLRSRSVSPVMRSQIVSSPLKLISENSHSPVLIHSSIRSSSPPIPPPRSLPASPRPPSCLARSTTSSPINVSEDRGSVCVTPPLVTTTKNNSLLRVSSKNDHATQYQSISPFLTSSLLLPSSFSPLQSGPPLPSKVSIDNSPPLPPRNSKPPLPPKNAKSIRRKSDSSKFATRPLPPLPFPRPGKDTPSPNASNKDLETLSTLSGASLDSLNSSEYESFYTMPYQEVKEYDCKSDSDTNKNLVKNSCISSFNKSSKATVTSVALSKPAFEGTKFMNQKRNQRIYQENARPKREKNRSLTHKLEDSGYLSTDSSESYCPQIDLPESISKVQDKVESCGGQNSETEESVCDGASESGAESTATDSFFYGNFKKTDVMKLPSGNTNSQVYPYSLRLSDVEVNSDTERHCMPIMVRP